MNCPKCGGEVANGSKFCNHCGASIEVVMERKCPGCGKMVGVQSKFCPDCGAAFEVDDEERVLGIHPEQLDHRGKIYKGLQEIENGTAKGDMIILGAKILAITVVLGIGALIFWGVWSFMK